MPDVFTKEKRSDVMSRIRSRGNKKTELALVRVFKQSGVKGWRRHALLRISDCGLQIGAAVATNPKQGPDDGVVREDGAQYGGEAPGVRASSRRLLRGEGVMVRPDFVFRERKVAVFVDGCFWHGCPKCYVRPRQNRKFWDAKFATNNERDRKVNKALKAAGWKVLRIWEHELRRKGEGRLRRKLERALGLGGGK